MAKKKQGAKPPVSTGGSTFGALVAKGALVVPVNQRPWEWTNRQLDELFDDLAETTSRWSKQGPDKRWEPADAPETLLPHFFGPFVLEHRDNGEREVVDGQQRLTAASVLVAIMRDANAAYCEGAPNDSRRIARSLRTAFDAWLHADPQSGDPQPRLCLDSTIHDFFNGYVIQSAGSNERTQYLADNPENVMTEAIDVRTALVGACHRMTRRLDTHLAEVNPDADPLQTVTHLQQMFQTLQKAFHIITVEIHRSGYAPQVFRGLNARGTSLNEADKIKNELFVVAPASDFDKIKQKWDDIVRGAPDRDAESFLRMRYVAVVGDTKKSDLYVNVKATELEKKSPSQCVTAWAKDATLMRYVSVVETHPNIGETTRRHLLDIKLMRHTYVRPLLLAAARVFLNSSPNDFAEAVLLARNVGFRELTMKSAQPETFLARIGPIARTLIATGDLAAMRAKLRDISPDGVFRDKFTEYHVATVPIQYYVLYELELAAGGDTGKLPAPHSTNPKALGSNIEHMLPRTISKVRTSEFSQWRDANKQPNSELIRKNLHRIGNLLLIENELNGELGDFDVAAKRTGDYPPGYEKLKNGATRRSYGNSEYKLAKRVAKDNTITDWTPESIEERQADLASFALRAWRLSARRTGKKSAAGPP